MILAIATHDNPADTGALHPLLAVPRRAGRRRDHRPDPQGPVGQRVRQPTPTSPPAARPSCTSPSPASRPGRPQPGGYAPAAMMPSWQAAMAARWTPPRGSALYKRRNAIIEPVFAQLFARLGRTLNYRGDKVTDLELHLWAASHNLLKAIGARTRRSATPPPDPPWQPHSGRRAPAAPGHPWPQPAKPQVMALPALAGPQAGTMNPIRISTTRTHATPASRPPPAAKSCDSLISVPSRPRIRAAVRRAGAAAMARVQTAGPPSSAPGYSVLPSALTGVMTSPSTSSPSRFPVTPSTASTTRILGSRSSTGSPTRSSLRIRRSDAECRTPSDRRIAWLCGQCDVRPEIQPTGTAAQSGHGGRAFGWLPNATKS